MTTSINIFINENDTLENVLNSFGYILQKKGFPKELKFIFNKQSNNYIGYAVFMLEGKAYKVFVLPKIIDEKLSDKSKIQQFLRYLNEFYRLALKKEFKVTAPIEWGRESNINKGEAQFDFDLHRKFKFINLLEEIHSFFRSHRSTKTRKVAYTSQSIRYKLSLQRNITSPDKSLIHQVRKESSIYSELAKITYGAILQFQYHKLDLLSDHHDLKQKVEALKMFLLQKFRVEKNYKLHLQLLVSSSVSKLFTKKHQHREVYRSILMLFGMERFWDDDSANVTFDFKGDYFFFRPEKLYELYVGEKLAEAYPNANIANSTDIKTTYKTYLNSCQREFETASEPDFIIDLGENGNIVADAKWKILDFTNKSSSPISASDLLKLERDAKVHAGSNNDSNILNMMLIYCKVLGGCSVGDIELKTEYTSSYKVTYRVKEIAFDLE